MFHPDVALRADANKAQHDGSYIAVKKIGSLDGVLFMQKCLSCLEPEGSACTRLLAALVVNA